ncbi:MAG: DUF302 domain-containing protein [Thermoanaerobaculia bacterium]
MIDYGIRITTHLPFEAAIEATKSALAAEGFGVLTEIDMQAKLKEKLGVGVARYTILGACNPPLAYKALQAEQEIGLLLPCNVIVYESGEETVVSAVDPNAMLGVIENNPAVAAVAREARAGLERAIRSIQ